MMNQMLNEALIHWPYVNELANYRPKNKAQYNYLSKRLDELLDEVALRGNKKLEGLVDIIGDHILEYEEKHEKEKHKIKITGVEALKFFMETHNIKQSDLPEIGSQSLVSEILNGNRKFTVEHIKALAKRFKVNVNTFIDV